MVRVTQLCLALLLALGWQSTSAEPMTIAKGVYYGAMYTYKAYQKLQTYLAEKTPEDQKLSVGEVKVLEKLNRVSDTIIDFKSELLDKIAEGLPSKFSDRSTLMFNAVKRINQQYRKFLDYAKEQAALEDKTLQDFADKVTTSSLAELGTFVETMYEKYLDDNVGDKSIVTVLANQTNRELLCTEFQSPYQLMIDLYNIITTSDSQALVVKFFGYDIQTKKNSTLKFEKERELDKRDFERRVSSAYDKVKRALAFASRELSSCDLSNPVPKVTYSKLERVFQAHVMDKREEKGLTSPSTCPRKCSDYKSNMWTNGLTTRTCKSHCESEPAEKRCNGKFADCEHISDELTVCLADSNSDRYYDWMVTESSAKYGQYTGKCDKSNEKSFKTDKGLLSLNPFPCGYCVCTCLYEDKNVDRYFSLAQVLSDYDDNKVVTGVRLRLIDHVHYIEIKQGVLGPNGTIDESTNKWKPIEEEDKVEDLSNLYEKNSKVYTVKRDQKTVYLDDIEPKSDTPIAVTGVKFNQIGESLRLEIEVSPFDYETGELYGKTEWKSSGENNLQDRKELLLNEATIPLNKRNRDISQSGLFVEFKITDLHADLGQNTVPFIDLQPLETKPPVPLAGVGLFVRHTQGSGGFLGLRLFQYNYAPHL